MDDSIFRSASTDLPEWIYWTVCVLIVYLVRCLSKYVLASLKKDKEECPNPVMCVSACAGTALLVLSQGDSAYVTEEALLFNRFTLLYITAYAALFSGNQIACQLKVQPCRGVGHYHSR